MSGRMGESGWQGEGVVVLLNRAEWPWRADPKSAIAQPKSSMSRAKKVVKKMSMFGMIFMMAKSTGERTDESTKYEASGETHRRLRDY